MFYLLGTLVVPEFLQFGGFIFALSRGFPISRGSTGSLLWHGDRGVGVECRSYGYPKIRWSMSILIYLSHFMSKLLCLKSHFFKSRLRLLYLSLLPEKCKKNRYNPLDDEENRSPKIIPSIPFPIHPTQSFIPNLPCIDNFKGDLGTESFSSSNPRGKPIFMEPVKCPSSHKRDLVRINFRQPGLRSDRLSVSTGNKIMGSYFGGELGMRVFPRAMC